jgi:hypothetical protein
MIFLTCGMVRVRDCMMCFWSGDDYYKSRRAAPCL